MKEKNNEYNKLILLDDYHKILKETQKILGEKGQVFHISSILVWNSEKIFSKQFKYDIIKKND